MKYKKKNIGKKTIFHTHTLLVLYVFALHYCWLPATTETQDNVIRIGKKRQMNRECLCDRDGREKRQREIKRERKRKNESTKEEQRKRTLELYNIKDAENHWIEAQKAA